MKKANYNDVYDLFEFAVNSAINNQKITIEEFHGCKDIDETYSVKVIEPMLLSVDDIYKFCVKYYHETKDCKSRKRGKCESRQFAHFICYEYLLPKPTLSKIGEIIGNKDHATVLHSCKTINNLLETDPSKRKILDEILKELRLKKGEKNYRYK